MKYGFLTGLPSENGLPSNTAGLKDTHFLMMCSKDKARLVPALQIHPETWVVFEAG